MSIIESIDFSIMLL